MEMSMGQNNRHQPHKALQLSEQEVSEGLQDYYYIRNDLYISTKYVTSLYYKREGVVIENIRVGVAILTKQGKDVYICLVKENAIEKKWEKWGIPKGGVESGEAMVSDNDSDLLNITAHREVYEELGYNISPSELGRCSVIMVDVPQRRDDTVNPKKMFVGGVLSDDPSIVKHTLNVYFLYPMDGDKRGFDINDPYKGRKDAPIGGRLDQMWLKLAPGSLQYKQIYKGMNKSTQLTIDQIVNSLDTITFH
ncbi:nudix hydrolase domain protein [Faustovirus]|nr:hypothetical protein F-LCD7_0311 [Faustovirus]QJX72078.1 nudix hydrolase domain protein [Faustovirus]QJX72572.1 nudix hydrolase domain protein [Faustovirus]QJX73069.1 nudix hydrolase domain protein [Faustovirus]QJX73576.1 nudix hydrolase domain protein [Faustovirus]